ncbi:MAG: hypothetical protein U9R52_01500 [Candidatus Omnitrophota bacterium]|nr:hypothetical protein [Candidatus Omnitrophota bacterium]
MPIKALYREDKIIAEPKMAWRFRYDNKNLFRKTVNKKYDVRINTDAENVIMT